MKIRQATIDDVDTIVELRHERATWLATHGYDQWSDAGLDSSTFRERVSTSINRGETWMATTATGTVLGTIAIDDRVDPRVWRPDERVDAAAIHRMITRVDAQGHGIGEALLNHANLIARERGLNWLRLDAWTTNTDLHRLYKKHGFQHVRTVPDAPTRSAALFQRYVAE